MELKNGMQHGRVDQDLHQSRELRPPNLGLIWLRRASPWPWVRCLEQCQADLLLSRAQVPSTTQWEKDLKVLRSPSLEGHHNKETMLPWVLQTLRFRSLWTMLQWAKLQRLWRSQALLMAIGAKAKVMEPISTKVTVKREQMILAKAKEKIKMGGERMAKARAKQTIPTLQQAKLNLLCLMISAKVKVMEKLDSHLKRKAFLMIPFLAKEKCKVRSFLQRVHLQNMEMTRLLRKQLHRKKTALRNQSRHHGATRGA
mmetsp:Transcript_11410/g.18723  ORF Transcript_11410/g.18723 Transcript_11410/m.18723 type:complete len:256 (-) Transcript_11410:544-1311(-)